MSFLLSQSSLNETHERRLSSDGYNQLKMCSCLAVVQNSSDCSMVAGSEMKTGALMKPSWRHEADWHSSWQSSCYAVSGDHWRRSAGEAGSYCDHQHVIIVTVRHGLRSQSPSLHLCHRSWRHGHYSGEFAKVSVPQLRYPCQL